MKLKMMIKGLLLCGISSFGVTLQAQPTAEYFSKESVFDANVTLPEEFLGYSIGDWHISPDALTGYMRLLAAENSKVSIKTIGYSHERHALSHVYISSPENIANLEGILKKHQQAKSAKEDILVINLAYSVHGNESSGGNASSLVAYYLAASKDPWVKDLLSKAVIIIEPTQNPDGFGRFAAFVNQHKGAVENFDSANRPHYEGWPSGRTNHYWFDLNRDWIFTVHPESQARIKAYQEWRPHLLGDYHEMGGQFPTYFFQPGHPKRTHPLTSKENQRLTFKLAEFHAKALDDRGQPYFTEERFDDFYYGKASAYPDATGAVGLLFEQSAVRGHARELGGVKIRFKEAIANQLATSLSLLKGGYAQRSALLEYRFSIIRENEKKASKDPIKGYVFSDDGDFARAEKLLNILKRHKIPVQGLTADIKVGKKTYKQGHAWVVQTKGAQYGLIKSLFETRTSFEDNVFYDISTWNLPLALNLPYSPLKKITNVTSDLTSVEKTRLWAGKTPVAYAFEWNQYQAPHLLQKMIAHDLHPRLALKPFSSHTFMDKPQKLDAGTIIIQPKTQKGHEKAQKILREYSDVKIHGLRSGLTLTGPDLGSTAMRNLRPIKVALLVGNKVSATEAGGIRYAVDHNFGIPLTLLDFDRVASVKLENYTHILLADGNYKSLTKIPKILKKWVKAGGIIIAQKKAAKWIEEKIIYTDEDHKKSQKSPLKIDVKRHAYQEYEQDLGKRRIAGAALKTKADLTHPLMFGYNRMEIPVFYNAKSTLSVPNNIYDTPLVFANNDLLISGYADQKQLNKIKNTPAVAVHRLGKGKVVLFSHDNTFRAIWLGTERLYANALFFTQAIETRKVEKPVSNDRRDE